MKPYATAVLTFLMGVLFTGPVLGQAEEKSLYERLGGRDAIYAVVGKAIGYIAEDARIAAYFTATIQENRVQHLHDMLTQQICELSGGPERYIGKNMKKAHKGMGITDEAFDALVEDFGKAFADFRIPQQEQNELLSVLAPMRKVMVGK